MLIFSFFIKKLNIVKSIVKNRIRMDFELNSKKNITLALELKSVELFLEQYVQFYNKNGVKHFPDSLYEIVDETSIYEVIFQIKKEVVSNEEKWVLITRSQVDSEWSAPIEKKETITEEYFDTLTELFNERNIKEVTEFSRFKKHFQKENRLHI